LNNEAKGRNGKEKKEEEETKKYKQKERMIETYIVLMIIRG
jgi:hypothetical protein